MVFIDSSSRWMANIIAMNLTNSPPLPKLKSSPSGGIHERSPLAHRRPDILRRRADRPAADGTRAVYGHLEDGEPQPGQRDLGLAEVDGRRNGEALQGAHEGRDD